MALPLRLRVQFQPVPTFGLAGAIGANGLAPTERRTAVACVEILVVTLLGALSYAIAAGRLSQPKDLLRLQLLKITAERRYGPYRPQVRPGWEGTNPTGAQVMPSVNGSPTARSPKHS